MSALHCCASILHSSIETLHSSSETLYSCSFHLSSFNFPFLENEVLEDLFVGSIIPSALQFLPRLMWVANGGGKLGRKPPVEGDRCELEASGGARSEAAYGWRLAVVEP